MAKAVRAKNHTHSLCRLPTGPHASSLDRQGAWLTLRTQRQVLVLSHTPPQFLPVPQISSRYRRYHRFGASLYIGPPRLALDRGKSKRYLPGPRRSSLVPLPLCSVAMPGVDRENNDLRGPLPSLVPLLTQFSDSPAPSVYRGGKPVGQ